MRVRDLLQDKSEVYTVQQDKTIHDAIAILVQHNIGALPVLDQDGNVVGIISERDILRETAHRPGRLKQTCVHERMTRDVIIGVPDDKVEDALALMTKNRIRHGAGAAGWHYFPGRCRKSLSGRARNRQSLFESVHVRRLSQKLLDNVAVITYTFRSTVGRT